MSSIGFHSCALCLLVFLLGTPAMRAQRIYERGTHLVLEDAQGRLRSLGPGFNPIPISDHKWLFIRGTRMGYGEEASCERPEARNGIVIYDTRTNKESLLFEKPLAEKMTGHDGACVYESADFSPSETTLYIVSPCSATAGCLDIVDTRTGAVRYVPGVDDVFAVRGGINAGDLIYSRRLMSKPTKDDIGHPYYPYIHARPDGSQIAIISDEDLAVVGGNAPVPILRAWLRSIKGRIFVQGEWIP